ncbi:MAG TPA: nucleoside monophosphate kinase [Candidatus Saccharimonadales bacterium]|nr:nucleoside monophosphate kinase [Candidatus Saccharimonadales bacterium]
MNKAKIIALVGMPGAGKGTCTDYISEKYGAPLIHFGNMVYEEVQRRGLDNVKDEKFVREDMRKQSGPAVLAHHVARKVKQAIEDGADRIVLDGLYSWSEYKYLHEMFDENLITIAVAAPRAVRYARVVARKDGHRQYTAEQVKERDIAEIENLEKGGPIAFADFTLVNEGAPEDLLNRLEKILAEISFTN